MLLKVFQPSIVNNNAGPTLKLRLRSLLAEYLPKGFKVGFCESIVANKTVATILYLDFDALKQDYISLATQTS